MTGKVYDRRTLQVDRDPTKQLAVEVGRFPKNPNGAQQLVEWFTEQFKLYTGIDLSSPEALMLSGAQWIQAIALIPEALWVAIADWFSKFVLGQNIPTGDGYGEFPQTWDWTIIEHPAMRWFANLRAFMTIDLTDENFDVADAAVGAFNGTLWSAYSWITYWYNAITSQAVTQVPVDQAAAQAQTLAQVQAAHAAAIADLQAMQQIGSGNAGLVSGDDFERDTLGPGWSVSADVAGTAAMEIVNGHDLSFVRDAALTLQNLRAVRTDPDDMETTSDYQIITMVEGAQTIDVVWLFGSDAQNSMVFRRNAAATQYVRVKLGWNYAQLLYRNGAGAETQIGTIVSNLGRGPGVTWSGWAGDGPTGIRTFRLYRNGELVSPDDWVDTTAATAVGSLNRGWEIGMGGGQQRPSSITRVRIADNNPTAVVGTYIRVSRHNTTPVAINGAAQYPNDFYDTVDRISPDLQWLPGSNCSVVVRDAGIYEVDLVLAGSSWNGVGTLRVFRDGVLAVDRAVNGGQWPDAPGWTPIQLRSQIYCDAGDTLTPGYNMSAFNTQGTPDGLRNYMQITKVGP